MVESAGYRQSSRITQPGAEKIDPANEMVWRQQLRRLDAESLRDAVLTANGELNLEMGGRGFFPMLPKEVLATQSIPGNGWGESAPSQLGRRSIYMFVKRTLRVPLMEAFDTATPDQSIAARSVTTIAPQALLWMNSSFMENETLAMADQLLALPIDDGSRVRELFERSMQRSPSKEEVVRFLSLLAEETPRWEELRAVPSDLAVVDRWNRFGGHWIEREDGGIEVSPDDGAKALWPTGLIINGQVEAEVMLKGEPGNAGLIFRVLRPFEGVNGLVGYYVGLSSTQVTLGRHQDDYAQIAASDRPIALDQWHHLRVELTGSRIKVWVDREDRPAIDVEDGSISEAGQVGFRTYQMRAGFRNLKVTSEQGEWFGATSKDSLVTPVVREVEARRRAWGDLARILFNTNEFVYVD